MFGDKKSSRARASKLKFKTVNEMYCQLRSTSSKKLRLPHRSWDKKAYKYKIVEPTAPSGEVDELDEHIFVVQVRIGEWIELCTALRSLI